MRYLVTGCAGFIGSTITDRLLASGHEVVGIDCFTDFYARSLKEKNLESARSFDRFTLHTVELGRDAVDSAVLDVDGIFHQAAQAGVRASWGNEFTTYTDCNVLATQQLLEAMVAAERSSGRMPRIVYASSSSVYGNALTRPTREDVVPAPISPYGVTKLAGEHLCNTYRHSYGIEAVSLRYFTVYGPRQRPDMAFHRFAKAALTGGEITVYDDGHQSRDFTYVDDVVAANLAAMDANVGAGVYNIGGGSTVTVREVLAELERICEHAIDVRYTERQRGDVRHTSADTSAAASDLGFAPAVALAEGLAREVEWVGSLLSSDS